MILQRDILLVPFPFSDLTNKKVRPVLVLSKDSFNNDSEDIVVCSITTTGKDLYSIPLSNKELGEGKLDLNCFIKAENLLKLDKKLVIKKIARLDKTTFQKVIHKINDLFS